jgi:hypothetical protein
MKLSIFSSCSLAAVLTVGVVLSACSEEQPPPTQSAQPQPQPQSQQPQVAAVNPAPPPAAAQAGAVAPSSYSPEALETLLAPIALYPDAVLAQVLASSTNPQEVLDAGNWLVANPDLQGEKLDTAAAALGLTPPMLALIHFPTVVDMMCMKLDWTTELGTAFQADESGVLEAVQRLRKQAAEMGNLRTSEQMKVTTEEQNSQQVIVVQPANPEVVYVPQYNPTTVYTTPAPAAVAPATTTATTTVVQDDGYSGGEMVATGLLAFGAGILVNEVFDDDDDDYYSPNWGYGGGGYYPPPYYPRYGNGYRPANGYQRPANYQRGFNNNNIYVNADGSDYFNRFEGGKNNYRQNAQSPISQARPNRSELSQLNQRAQNATRPATQGLAGNSKVQGTYAGAKPDARPRSAAQVSRPAVKAPTGAYKGASPAARQKMNPKTAGVRDRGHTPATRAKANVEPKSISKQSRPTQTAQRQSSSRSSAFEGSRQSGKTERAASQRGRASAHKGGGRSGGGQSGRGGRGR